ncbi:MAG TPA: TonB-dependent receptor, partial [Sphingomonadaceae bacterium]|nr:TonB-dependent receptor [Sphingomonadaceae bacterium]
MAILLLAGGHPAAAADSAEGADAPISDIIVTAQFREQNLQTTPLAITAINAQMLEARNQRSIDDVAAQAPNVSLAPLPSALGPSLGASIRGVGQFDYSAALEPGVGMYVDDVYYSTLTGSIFDLLDIDRVEILRGPQGTLAGKNSLGGAIKLYTKKPGPEGGGFVELTTGSYNRIDARAAATFTLVPDRLYARIAGVTRHRDGYVTNYDFACMNPTLVTPTFPRTNVGPDCKIGTSGGQSMSAGRVSLRWTPSETFEVNVTGDITHDTSEVQASTMIEADSRLNKTLEGVLYDEKFVPADPYAAYSTFTNPTSPFGAYAIPPINHFFGKGVSVTMDLELSDSLSLKSITAYRRYKAQFAEDGDLSPFGLQQTLNTVRHHSFMQELRLNGAIGDAVEWTIGGFYFDQKNNNAGRIDLGYSDFEFLTDDDVPSTTKAVFAHLAWEVFSGLTLTGGLRYTDEKKSYTYFRRNPDFTPNVRNETIDGKTGDYSGDRVDYRLNIAYEWTPDIMTYAQFATGFKGGGINPRPFFPEQVAPFGPETLKAYEVGIKTWLLDRRIRFNGAYFYNDYKGLQLTLQACPNYSPSPTAPCAMPANAGDAKVQGLEFETTITPVDGFILDGSISYIDFQYKKIGANVQGVTLDSVAPFTPKWKWNLGVQYELPIGD